MLSMLDDTIPSMLALGAVMALWGKVWPYLLMFVGFSVIIFIHELGHFMVAKWTGVKVERFAIGFGREIVGFTRGETRYSFNMLPLGGFVKMLGQEDFDDKSEELRFKDNPRAFINKPVAHRMAIVSAGVIMNTLLACLLFMIVFSIGKDSISPRIAYVVPDSPAELSGLRPGDMIREINGETILAFNEVQMAIVLAAPHEPIDFVVEREGELKSISVQPQYLHPENTREARRLVVGIKPGRTREIVYLGPEIDRSRDDHPHIGDMIVEIAGTEITDQNISAVLPALAYAGSEIYVERRNPDDPDAPLSRVQVKVPPILALYPGGDLSGSVSVLGLTPLIRFDMVDKKGRAYLAGIDVGDTILSWDDVLYPTTITISRSIRDKPERDIHFKVSRPDGRIVEGFVRPKRNSRGPATIGAICEPIADFDLPPDEPRARLTLVRPGGIADRAGVEPGDLVLSCGGITNPLMAEVNETIRGGTKQRIELKLQKADGRSITTWVVPQAPGAIDASVKLIANDLLRVADVVPTLDGRPSPAAEAGLTPGVLITEVEGQPITQWVELIELFHQHAGMTVRVAYKDTEGTAHVTDFTVPHSVRTLLGIGSEARILSIDGQKTVKIPMPRGGREDVAVGYRKGTREILSQLIGRTDVSVTFRRNPLAPIETETLTVTNDMVFPWLAHVAYDPSIAVATEIIPLKGENVLEAVEIGLRKTYYFIFQVYKMLERMIFTRSVGIDNMSGPLGIIDIGGRAARASFVDFLFFMAIISANLAVLNFLPLPIVDGGMMVFLVIEKIKGTPVSLRVQVATQMIGIFLIAGIFLYVTFNDAMRLWG